MDMGPSVLAANDIPDPEPQGEQLPLLSPEVSQELQKHAAEQDFRREKQQKAWQFLKDYGWPGSQELNRVLQRPGEDILRAWYDHHAR
ncbi:MAG: hypothetical protein NTZ05_10590 [Chloroflexi bacterium]|nr:hypothetical protein [Chloroflexota bacterium]